MVTQHQDGSVTLTGDADPTRTEEIPAGLPTEEVVARQQAFFALEPTDPA